MELENKQNKSGWGGKREGAGRKPGSTQRVSVTSLLDTLSTKTGGQNYETILLEDFLAARNSGDTQLTLKYHTLLSSKLLATLNAVEVEEVGDAVNAKQQAFEEALGKLQSINKEA